MREQFVDLILKRLENGAETVSRDFRAENETLKTRYCAIDDLLPEETARKFFDVFPPGGKMRLLDSFREKKYTSK